VLSRRQRDRLAVVLVETRNPLNLGAAARAMSNFGFDRLRVVEPYEVAFREARSAMGARELLEAAEECPSIAAAVSDCRLVVGTSAIGKRQLQHPVRTLAHGAQLIRHHLRFDRVAILFGSEKTGLSNQDLSHCHWLLHIPTRAQHLSMNLAQAVAVTLYEMVRAAQPERSNIKVEVATAGDLERLTQLLLACATESGFVSTGSAGSREQKLRRLVHRVNLPPADVQMLLGLARQILWSLRPGS